MVESKEKIQRFLTEIPHPNDEQIMAFCRKNDIEPEKIRSLVTKNTMIPAIFGKVSLEQIESSPQGTEFRKMIETGDERCQPWLDRAAQVLSEKESAAKEFASLTTKIKERTLIGVAAQLRKKNMMVLINNEFCYEDENGKMYISKLRSEKELENID